MKGDHRSPLWIHPGAVEHYRDGSTYDARYEGRTEDIEFYRRITRQAQNILEYGAGTGRITLPLARAGARVCAVDLSASMLTVLERRLAEEAPEVRKRVSLLQADMRSYRSRRKFDAVLVGFHTFCHLYSRDDVKMFLAQARAHLNPGGTLAFDVPIPHIDARGYDALSQVCVAEMDGSEAPELLTQRWYQPEEVRMHLSYAGFSHVKFFGDFSKDPPTEDADFLAVTARRPLEEPKRASKTRSSS